MDKQSKDLDKAVVLAAPYNDEAWESFKLSCKKLKERYAALTSQASERQLTQHNNIMSLTSDSKALFRKLAEDANNWGGQPLVDINPSERGNLTQLKIAGLITTKNDGKDTFAVFTPAGVAMALESGVKIDLDYY